MNDVASPPVRFGPYAFDMETGELTKSGQVIPLRPQAAQILRYLASHPGRLVTREDLRGELWAAGTFVDFEHGLNLCIHEIRAALHDDASSPMYIETLPRRGYRFIAALDAKVAAESVSAVASGTPLQPPESSEPPQRASRWIRAAAVAAFAAVVLAIVIVSSRSGARDTAASTPPPRPTAVTVALLPLVDVAGRAGEEYFAEGVTSELQEQLEAMDTLRVRARWSVLQYRDTKKSPAEIARELEVSSLVSGSILHTGDRTRLNLRLVDARSGAALWAESYETTLADLPAVERRAARSIARSLGHSANVIGEPPGQGQVDAEAHAVVLKAMSATTAEGFREELHRAVAMDPQFGLAWSLLADSYVSDTWFAQTMPPAVGYPKAKEYALKALAIDDSDSSAHTAVAAVKLHHEWDWAGAEREFRRAIELSPSDAFAHHIYSHYLLTMDRLTESVAESRIASDLDPLNPILSTCVGWHCLYARQYDDAVAECLKLINDNKANAVTYYYLGRVYVRQGKLKEGIAALEIAAKKATDLNAIMATLAYAYGRAGRRSDAQRTLRILTERGRTRYVAAFDIAIIHAGLGDRDRAFEWLDRAFLERSTWMVHVKWDDRFATLRDDPRFVLLLRRMGMPNPASVQAVETRVPERYSRVAAGR